MTNCQPSDCAMTENRDHEPASIDRCPETTPKSFPVIALGASAGGQAALLRFLEHLPPTPGMAFIAILHLSRRHEGNLDRILQRATKLPVVQVKERTLLEPDHFYVISPRKLLTVEGDHLCATNAEHALVPPVAVDLLMRSVAVRYRERAIAVVLSGTGSDGTAGIARIKECGGVAMAQLPEDAEYDDMPRSAIASGHVDRVMAVADMPAALQELWANARCIALPASGDDAHPNPALLDTNAAAEKALHDILALMRERTGHDFSQYKRATVLRRMERRLQVRVLPDLPSYLAFLQANEDETAPLLADMLISVTNFFRDREAFEALEREVITPLVAGAAPDRAIRAWSMGCATGEEAYSVAMLLDEELKRQEHGATFQVFASDIDERALAVARRGTYPHSILLDVPPVRLRDHFVEHDHQYRILKPLRERVVFASHNALRDPPFSQLDLIVCRNVLIYLNRDIQEKLLQVFHYALRERGVLFLGSSESADMGGELFEIVDKKHRLYRVRAREGARRTPSLPLRVITDRLPPLASATVAGGPGTSYADVHQRALEQYAPPSVIVDADATVLHMSQSAGRYLRHPGGVPTHNLLAQVRGELRIELRSALFQAMQGGRSVEARRVRMEIDGADAFVNMIVRPFGGEQARCALVLFEQVEETMGGSAAVVRDGDDPVVEQLERELEQTRGTLQATIEYSETSAEELRASNEELQSINEELRSATEELETSAEELQSVNEELITVNAELKAKVEETERAHDDLDNLIASTDIPLVFVDTGLRIRRFTPRAASIFRILPADVGRSLLDLAHRLDYPQLATDLASVASSERPNEREVHAHDGRTFLARVSPYQTTKRESEGAVITFLDISPLREAEHRADSSEEDMRTALQSSSDFAVIATDPNGAITGWNSGAENIFGYTQDEIAGLTISVLFTPEDRERGADVQEMETARLTGRAEDNRWHLRKDGSRVFCSGVTTPASVEGLRGYVKIARDVTLQQMTAQEREQQLEQARLRRANAEAAMALKDEFLAVMSHELKHPLNLIHVNAEILSRTATAALGAQPHALRAMDTLKHAVRTQGKIIDDLLDLSRVRTGKLTLDMVAVDLVTLGGGAVEAVAGDGPGREIEIGFEAGEASVLVNGDIARLNQIIWNLLSNATKFTPPGGRIAVRVSTDGAFGRLDVVDSGQGIDPAFLPRVFDMFGQARARATTAQGGMGIGLALVKQLAEHHGGRVEGASEGLGHGARFSVWIPRYTRPLAAVPQADAAAPNCAGLHILAVDDDPLTVESLRVLLEIEGAKVVIATSATEALSMVQERVPDLVLSDLGMPHMDGFQLLAALRAIPGCGSLPVIALTGFGRSNDVVRAQKAGFSAHLAKPVRLDELWKRIADVVPTGRANTDRTAPAGHSAPE